MLKIGDFSKLSRISIQMLRHYDHIGLLTPVLVDQFSGYRYYAESQLPVANQIRAMKDMGLGLAAIKDLLECSDEKITETLESHLNELHDELVVLNAKILLTKNRLTAVIKGSDIPEFHVALKQIPGMPVISCRGLLQGYNQEGSLWDQLFIEMERQNVRRSTPALSIAIFHDESYMEQDIDVEVQCAVDGHYKDNGNVSFTVRKPVTAATVIYQGDYSMLVHVNAEIARWISANRYVMSGPGFNIYHISPGDTNDPQNMVTEVCFPVERQY